MKQQPKQRTRSTTTKRKTAKQNKPVRRKQTAKAGAPPSPVPVPPVSAIEGKVSKKDTVIALLQREHGATLNDLTTATGWQAHSVRGFISGTLKKKLGLTVESSKREHEHLYKINR